MVSRVFSLKYQRQNQRRPAILVIFCTSESVAFIIPILRPTFSQKPNFSRGIKYMSMVFVLCYLYKAYLFFFDTKTAFSVVIIFRHFHVQYAGNPGNCGGGSTWNTWYRSLIDSSDWFCRFNKRCNETGRQKSTGKWERMARTVLLEQRPLKSLPILVSRLLHSHWAIPTFLHYYLTCICINSFKYSAVLSPLLHPSP